MPGQNKTTLPESHLFSSIALLRLRWESSRVQNPKMPMLNISSSSALTGIPSLSPLHLLFPCFCWILGHVWGSESLALLIHGVISFSVFTSSASLGVRSSIPAGSYVNNQHILWADGACPGQDAPHGRRKSLLGNEILCEDHHEVTEEVKWKTWTKFIIRKRQKFFWARSCFICEMMEVRGDPVHFLRKGFPRGFFQAQKPTCDTCQHKGWQQRGWQGRQQQPANWAAFPCDQGQGQRKRCL